MISGNKEWSYYLVYVLAAFIGFALKSLLYANFIKLREEAASWKMQSA